MSGLVTLFGGSGFIGTQAVRALAKRGWRVRVAVRRPHLAHKLRPMGDVGQIQLVRAHVGVRDSVEQALEGADACVNLVGILHETGSRRFEALHVEAARTVAEAAAAQGVGRLVQMSALGADPNSPSLYARTKAAGEAAVREAFPGAVILRPSVVFGPGDGFFNRFAAMTAWSPILPLVGGGTTKFQPVYVGDVAEAIARVVSDPTTAGNTYELTGPATYTFEELMRFVLAQTGKSRLLLPLPWGVAGLIGKAGDVQGFLLPGAPILTSDQVRQLRRDNVSAPGTPGLKDLGIEPASVEAVVPGYLWRYRKGGQFAEAAPAA